MAERKHEQLGRELELDRRGAEPDLAAAADDDIGDDLLGLIFTACHPVLLDRGPGGADAAAAGRPDHDEIARAFLVPEPTVAQRIVRAKRTLADAERALRGAARPDELDERLASVLEVIYLVFNEGYSATAGDDWMRPGLCEEALRLGRILAGLAPARARGARPGGADGDPGLAHRGPASGPGGEPVLLADQDRARWDCVLVGRGLKALDRAEELGGAPGPYALQAAIAACHARAPHAPRRPTGRASPRSTSAGRADRSPVVELNRAVARGGWPSAPRRAWRWSTG